MKKNFFHAFELFLFIFLLLGCQTVNPPPKAQNETYQDVSTALESMAEAISGKDLSQEDLKKLNQQIKNDPQAQSAIEAITQSAGGGQSVIMYCPKDGKRYAGNIKKCPVHGVDLEILQ